MITIDEFAKVELKVGTVLEALEIQGSEKLLMLKVDLGEDKHKQILSGIKQWYKPEDLKGKQFVFVTNLESRVIMKLESEGMMLCASANKPVLIKPIKKVTSGTKIR